MPVFSAFYKIVKSYALTFGLYFAIFIGITMIISAANSRPQQGDFTENKVPMSVINNDDSEISKNLEAFLYEKHKPVPLANSLEAMQDAIYNRDSHYVLIIPKGYGSALQAGKPAVLDKTTVPGYMSALQVDNLVNSYISTLKTFLQNGQGPQKAAENTKASLEVAAEVSLTQKAAPVATKGVLAYFRYLCYAMLGMLMAGLSPVFISFNSRQLTARMNASALSLRSKKNQLLLGTVLLAMLFFAASVLCAILFYGSATFKPSGLAAIMCAFVFTLFATALGYLVGQLSRTYSALSAISNVVSLGMCFLGGVYVPLEVMSPSMQNVAKFFPTYWYVTSIEKAAQLTSLSQMGEIFKNMLMLLFFTLAVLSAGVAVAKQRQSS